MVWYQSSLFNTQRALWLLDTQVIFFLSFFFLSPTIELCIYRISNYILQGATRGLHHGRKAEFFNSSYLLDGAPSRFLRAETYRAEAKIEIWWKSSMKSSHNTVVEFDNLSIIKPLPSTYKSSLQLRTAPKAHAHTLMSAASSSVSCGFYSFELKFDCMK